MEFKTRESKPQKTRHMTDEPTATVEDPSEMYEDHTENFVQQGELDCLMREKVRAQLVDLKKTQSDILIPQCSDLENQTKQFLRKLQSLSNSKDRANQLELELLYKNYKTRSLLNIAMGLAKSRLQEQERDRIKWWFSGAETGFLRGDFANMDAAKSFRVPTAFMSGHTAARGNNAYDPDTGELIPVKAE